MMAERSANRVRTVAIMSLSVALAAAGAFIKIPGPVGTVALDSWPGYACALLLGSQGAWVALCGHLVSALVSGFPLGFWLHGVIAVEMALCALAFAWASRRLGALAGAIVAILLNGPAATFVLIPWLGRPLVIALLAPLTVAAAFNVILAIIVARAARRLPSVEGGTHRG